MTMQQGNIANWPQDQEHPLLNSVVLKQVFEYLQPSASLDTLKSVRQVCKVWRNESLGLWRETAVLKLSAEMLDDPELSTITQLLEKPFHKYKLNNATINILDCFEEGTQANVFWSTVGPHVKHLILTGVSFRCSGFLKPVHKPMHAFLHFLIDKLPHLSTLDIQDTSLKVPGIQLQLHYEHNKESILGFPHPSLVFVKLNDSMAQYFAFSNLPNLQHLALDRCESLYRIFRNQQYFDCDFKLVYSNLKVLELILPERTSFKHGHEERRLSWLNLLVSFPGAPQP